MKRRTVELLLVSVVAIGVGAEIGIIAAWITGR
jgi:hypothetical protein